MECLLSCRGILTHDALTADIEFNQGDTACRFASLSPSQSFRIQEALSGLYSSILGCTSRVAMNRRGGSFFLATESVYSLILLEPGL